MPEKAVFSNTMYDLLKWFVQVWIPSLGSLYFGLAQLWDLPEPEKVVGTLALIATFLGITITISNRNYINSGKNIDGEIVVLKSDDKTIFSLELNADPNDLLTMDRVVFGVVKDRRDSQ